MPNVPTVISAVGRMSHPPPPAHDRSRLLPDFSSHFKRIALRELWQEELDGKRTRVTFIGKLAQNRLERRHPVTQDDAGRLLQQLPWQIRRVLEVHVPDFALLDQ